MSKYREILVRIPDCIYEQIVDCLSHHVAEGSRGCGFCDALGAQVIAAAGRPGERVRLALGHTPGHDHSARCEPAGMPALTLEPSAN
jgi:hypothetical protein